MPRISKVDSAELKHLYTEVGLGMEALAKHFGVRLNSIYKRVHSLGIADSSRVAPSKVSDQLLEQEYKLGLGVEAIAKKYALAPEPVRRKLIRLGVLDSSKQLQASGLPRRKRRLKSQEFTDATKRQRFEEEQGVCQECKRLVGAHWRQATYHHIITCKNGGTADPTNCMVLHFECHNDPEIFRRLHGFDIEHLKNY